MNQEQENSDLQFSQEMQDYVDELVSIADKVNEKSQKSANIRLLVDGFDIPLRVDDLPLLFIGGRLLPNILAYLVNILPQFIYPYVVAYLQDLSSMREDPITINELFEYLKTD